MHSDFSSSRPGAIVSLAGVALSMWGFFLPIFIEGIPQIPESAHPVYEWSRSFPPPDSLSFSVDFFDSLTWLSLLVILATSGVALFRTPLPWLIWLKRVAAGGGLIIRLLLEYFVLAFSSIGYARVEIAWGFVVVPLGFLVTVLGVFLEGVLQRQKRVDHP